MRERHNCGGILRHARVTIGRDYGNLYVENEVPGLRCSRCREEVLTRNVALVLEKRFYIQEKVRRRSTGTMTTIQSPTIVASDKGIGWTEDVSQTISSAYPVLGYAS
jgi:hypothetical protein